MNALCCSRPVKLTLRLMALAALLVALAPNGTAYSDDRLVQRQHEFDGSCGDGPGSLSHRERAGGEGPQRLVKAPQPPLKPLPEGEGKEWVSQNQRDNALVPYRIVDGAIPVPLTNQPGDPERGRRVVLDRDRGDCTICHAMPLPQREFHGTLGPPLDGVARRTTSGVLRLRLVDPKALNPSTIMPAYYKVEGLHRVLDRYSGKPILTAPQIEDVVAYLLTLTN